MPISRDTFGITSDAATVERYTLVNAHGLEADIMTYGATVTALRVPDRRGKLGDVVLGFDTLAPYLDEHPYFGAVIGRYANRIADGRFELNGRPYTLARNNGPHHLHGGPNGFHRQVWNAQTDVSADGPRLRLTYESRDGEEGYPGNLSVSVDYTVTEQDELRIDYRASTDQPTVVNLTNHTYFNLAGTGDILSHELELRASRFVPINATLIPLGELHAVRGTPMDFTIARAIGAGITADDEQIRYGLGYDHTWVLDKDPGSINLAARVYAPATGRAMDVFTTEPGVQFYSGNQLDGSLTGKSGISYQQHAGLCLETHHFPDSPNHAQFPSTVLRPGEEYRQTTIYRFSVRP